MHTVVHVLCQLRLQLLQGRNCGSCWLLAAGPVRCCGWRHPAMLRCCVTAGLGCLAVYAAQAGLRLQHCLQPVQYIAALAHSCALQRLCDATVQLVPLGLQRFPAFCCCCCCCRHGDVLHNVERWCKDQLLSRAFATCHNCLNHNRLQLTVACRTAVPCVRFGLKHCQITSTSLASIAATIISTTAAAAAVPSDTQHLPDPTATSAHLL